MVEFIKSRLMWGLVCVGGIGCSSQPLDVAQGGPSQGDPGAEARLRPTSASLLPASDLHATTEANGARSTFRDVGSANLTGGGRRELVTPPLWIQQLGDDVLVDLRAPTLGANPDWTGELKVYVSDPAIAGHERYVGGRSLTNLSRGVTSRIRVPIPSVVKPLLQSGERLKLVLQVPPDSAPFFVRQLAFDDVTAKALPSTATIKLKLPSKSALANTLVSGVASVTLSDRVNLSGPAGLTVTSLGTTELGADGLISGSVRSVGTVLLRERAKVTGDLTSQTGFNHQSIWTVGGALNAPQSLSPLVEQELFVQYPASSQPITLEPDQSASASPGAFTALSLKSRSKLTLAPGDYYFDSIQLEPSAELRLSDPTRPVVLHVKGELTYRGSMPNALPANVLWMSSGSSNVEIGAPLVGTLLAPAANVHLVSATGVGHRGAVFGNNVLVDAGSIFQLVPFSGWSQLVRPIVPSDASPTSAFRARWVYSSGEPIQSFSYGPAPTGFRVLAGGQPNEVPTQGLSFEIQNLTAGMGGMTVAYSVIMKSWGLGNFYADVPLQSASAQVTLAPGAKKTIDVSNLPSILGVKSTDMPAKGDIVIGLHKLNGGVVDATPFAYLRMPQFFYHFSDDLTQVFTYSLERASALLAPSGMQPKDGVIERYAGSVYHANLFAPAGKLGAETADAARDRLLTTFADRPAQLYGIRWDAQRPGETPHAVIPPGATVGGFNDPYNPSDGPTGICATWPTVFVDNGEEPFPPRSQNEFKNIVDFLPAAFNRAELYTHDGTLIKTTRLNQFGCFDEAQQLGKGDYLLRVYSSQISNNGVQFNVTRFEPPQTADTDKEVSVTYAVFVNAPGHTSSSGSTSFTVTTGMWTETTHLAAFASHLLARDQAGVDFGLTRGTAASPRLYPILVNTAGISNFNGSALEINAFLTENNWVSDARWKFVLGHEFGHMVQGFAGAGLPVSYNFVGNEVSSKWTDPRDPATARDTAQLVNDCTCDVVEDGNNRLHCLQSIETSSSAQTEAFGHFMASRVWNYAPVDAQNDGTCHFTYYKQVGASDIVSSAQLPPASIDCSKVYKHRKLACGHVAITSQMAPIEAASEVDWLTFFRALTTSAANPVTVGDIMSWYTTACGGSCNNVPLTFAGLRAGVPANRQAFFDQTATTYGVN